MKLIKRIQLKKIVIILIAIICFFGGNIHQLHAQCTQPPNISYTGVSANYLPGFAITPLSPINIGGAITLDKFVSTYAGIGVLGNVNGLATLSSFDSPNGIVFDTSGNLFIADDQNNIIRKISALGIVSTFAGSGSEGSADGQGTLASFNNPEGIAIDISGNIYVADRSSNKIRKITPTGLVTTFAGSGSAGSADGQGVLATFYVPTAVALDASGNVYVTDSWNNKIRKITPSGMVSTLAGNGSAGGTNGQGSIATFYYPTSIVVDSLNYIYVADNSGNKIRKITPTGLVSTFAGTGIPGLTDGNGTSASFYWPAGITMKNGEFYVTDRGNQKIRKITYSGTVTTYAGSPNIGSLDGRANTASFNYPAGIALNSKGNVFVADQYNHKIRMIDFRKYYITPNLPKGLIFDSITGIISGTPIEVTASRTYTILTQNTCGNNSTNINFATCSPSVSISNIGICKGSLPFTWNGLLFTSAGTQTKHLTNFCGLDSAATLNLAVIDSVPNISYTGVNSIYPIGGSVLTLTPTNLGGASKNGTRVTTFAGNGNADTLNGQGALASFTYPVGIATDSIGNFYVTDQNSHKIRKITPAGFVTTIAGNGNPGNSEGQGSLASFNTPMDIVVDKLGNLFVADCYNYKVRKITPTGLVSTLAGTGTFGDVDGQGTAAAFGVISGIAIDSNGNLYVADQAKNKIRKITPSGLVSTYAGSVSGDINGVAASARFNYPTKIAIDSIGNLYVTDLGNHKIKKITPSGIVSTLAGYYTIGSADGQGIAATFYSPSGITIDKQGNLYVTDQGNHKIRKITPTGLVSTYAGNGVQSNINAQGSIASFNQPSDIAIDASGNLYVTDYGNHLIRRISTGNYFISPKLSNGLTIDSLTGIISGTPITGTANTIYTVSTQNNCGLNSTTLNFSTCSNTFSTTNLEICKEMLPYTWNGLIFNSQGTQSKHFINYCGLDSTATLNLFVDSIPKISYLGVNSIYKVDSLIVPLLPNNIGGFPRLGSKTSTLAGIGTIGSNNGQGIAASFNFPTGLVTDSLGNIYVTDKNNHLIRKVSRSGMVSTFAGNGNAGNSNGQGNLASFFFPSAIAIDKQGSLYVADKNNHLIRKISSAGLVTTFAGSGSVGNADGQGNLASFNAPSGVAVDSIGNVFVTDQLNHKIRKITPTGLVSTFAGNGSSGSVNGQGALATFFNPEGIAINSNGELFVADKNNNKIRKINSAGLVSNFAGSGSTGSVNGIGTTASFFYPTAIAIDINNNLYVTDQSNHKIRKITSTGLVTTYAGSGAQGTINGHGTLASFNFPTGITIDGTGNIYVADQSNHKIIKIISGNYFISSELPSGLTIDSISGIISGTPNNISGSKTYIITTQNFCGLSYDTIIINACSPTFSNSTIRICKTSLPYTWNGLVFDSACVKTKHLQNFCGLDSAATLTLLVDSVPNISFHNVSNSYAVGQPIANLIPNNSGGVPTLAAGIKTYAGNGSAGSKNGQSDTATFWSPYGLVKDSAGNVFVTDRSNNKIRKISSTGLVSTFAGSGATGSANGQGIAASFTFPYGITIDKFGNLFIADRSSHKIRKITPSGLVSTFAGSGSTGSADGLGTAAQFYAPTGISFDTAGNLLVTDQLNHKIRKITPAGLVSTIAGMGVQGFLDGQGLTARFRYPDGIVVDSNGNIFVADQSNHRIRKITPSGLVSTFAGNGVAGSTDGIGTLAQFNNPSGLTFDASGNLFVTDYSNHKIRKVSPSGVVSTFAGTGNIGSGDGHYSSATFNFPTGIVIDSDKNMFVADYNNNKIRKIDYRNYFIKPQLPAGLYMDSITGIISGTPSVSTDSTIYTVTTQNNCGINQTSFGLFPCISSASFDTINICSSTLPFSWNGLNFNTSGTQSKQLINTTGCDSTATLTLNVNNIPNIGFKITSDSVQCLQGNQFSFIDTSSINSGVLNRKWNFGEGNSDTSSILSSIKTYANSGMYVVKLISLTSNNCKDSITKTVTVNASALANFAINNAAQCLTGNSFAFTNNSTNSTTQTWNFGDATNSTVLSPIKTYVNTGSYSVKLVAKNANNCPDSIIKTVYVNEQPVIGTIIGNATPSSITTPFTYIVLNQANIAYNWTVTNGTIQSGQGTNAVNIVWPTTGTGNLIAKITNNSGCYDSTNLLITITNVGVNNLSLNNDLKVYPNPTKNSITITNKTNLVGKKYIITNLIGQTIITGKLNLDETIVNLETLQSGVYLLSIDGMNKQSIKVIKE